MKNYLSSAFQAFLLVSGYIPSHRVRIIILRLFGSRIQRDVRLHYGCEIRKPQRLTIDRSCIIGWKSVLDARGGITIGENVNISSEVAIWTAQHDPQSPDFGTKIAPVVIEKYAWVSFRTTILPGVTIGEGAVVAAGSIVTKDVPPYTISAGIPAKVIGTRNPDLTYQLVTSENKMRFI